MLTINFASSILIYRGLIGKVEILGISSIIRGIVNCVDPIN